MALVQHSYGLKFHYEAVIASGFPTSFMPEDPFQVGPFATLSSKQIVGGSNPPWDAT